MQAHELCSILNNNIAPLKSFIIREISERYTIIQGLISFSIREDNVFMHLVESAPFNIGRNKVYEGVAGNLVAFACKTSFRNNLLGFVSFFSKTRLIDHYIKSLGAYHFGGHLMVITTEPAQILVDKYFKE